MREDRLLLKLCETERRISRFAEIAPVGIYDFATTGDVLWANSHFYEILGVPEEHRGSSFVWKDYILPEDHDRADTEMARSIIVE
jgi:PAS domain-containing protein